MTGSTEGAPQSPMSEGRVSSCTCGEFDCEACIENAEGRVSSEPPHPVFCSCAIPCRTCGHECEEHAGSMWYGTGPRRCRVDGCKCKGAYIGMTPARCKQRENGDV